MTGRTRTGILGGTFDPVHLGHRDVAMAARAALGLDTVLLVPSLVPPHRQHPPAASGHDRLAMVELAAADDKGLEASDLELRSEGPSYTSRTLETLTRGNDPLQFFFITGADAFAEISSWHDYPDVLDLSHFVVVSRPGHPTAQLAQQLPELATRMRRPPSDPAGHPADMATGVWLIDADTQDISSSDIRMRRAAGLPIGDLVSPSVAAYVIEHQLYTKATPDSVLHSNNDH